MIVASGGNAVIADIKGGEVLAAKLGKQTVFHPTDVANEDQARACVERALKEFGGLQGLVNCAGIAVGEKTIGKEGPHSLASFTKVVTVNLIGSFNMIRLAADAMAKGNPNAAGERGVIVNTASVAAFDGQIGQAAYSASKGGIVGMTLPIARDLSRSGIRVVTIAPGIFETPMLLGNAQGDPGLAREAGAVSLAAGQAGRVRRAGQAHLRERDAQRRDHPSRRGDSDGTEMRHEARKSGARREARSAGHEARGARLRGERRGGTRPSQVHG